VQRITSCLEVLDVFMRQSCPLVASMIVAEKHSGSGGFATVVECCSSILGMYDVTCHKSSQKFTTDYYLSVPDRVSLWSVYCTRHCPCLSL
jgi:hypothetical protein